MFADMETVEDENYRIIDKIRSWPWYIAIPRDIILFYVGLCYGTYDVYPPKCSFYEGPPDQCAFHEAISFGFRMSNFWSTLIYALCWFTLALVSPIAKQILGSPPIQFVGRISYSLYLLHGFVYQWFSWELVKYLVLNLDWDYNYATYFAYFNSLPLLFLVSWIFTEIVDTPSKDFANEFDQACRNTQKKGIFEKLWETSWIKIIVFVVYMALFISTCLIIDLFK